MRGFVFSALIITIMIASACSKINDTTEMNIIVSPAPVAYNIPIITSLDTGTTIATIPVQFNLDEMIKKQNERLSSGDVKSIRLNSLILTITDTLPDVTFANFERLQMTIQGSNQTYAALASLNPGDSKVKTLNIPVTATVNDLNDIVAGGTINYIIRGKLRRATDKVYAITAAATFRVELRL
jgi:hypothetical protein